jgi:hypothetical protein
MATYKPIIITSEFRTFCRLGANVGKDDALNVYIRDMQELEFRASVDEAFYNDCISDLTSKPQLLTFVNDYVKPYLICGAYENFLLWHGNNVTQYGVRQMNEDTSVEVTDKMKGELLADAKRKTNAYLTILKRELFNADYTFDGVIYSFFNDPQKSELKRSIGIKQVGYVSKNYEVNKSTGGRIGYGD